MLSALSPNCHGYGCDTSIIIRTLYHERTQGDEIQDYYHKRDEAVKYFLILFAVIERAPGFERIPKRSEAIPRLARTLRRFKTR